MCDRNHSTKSGSDSTPTKRAEASPARCDNQQTRGPRTNLAIVSRPQEPERPTCHTVRCREGEHISKGQTQTAKPELHNDKVVLRSENSLHERHPLHVLLVHTRKKPLAGRSPRYQIPKQENISPERGKFCRKSRQCVFHKRSFSRGHSCESLSEGRRQVKRAYGEALEVVIAVDPDSGTVPRHSWTERV